MNTVTTRGSVEPGEWRTGLSASRVLLERHACEAHLNAFDTLEFTDTPPDPDILDTILGAVGWRITLTDAPPGPAEFFRLLADHRLPVNLGTETQISVFALGGGSWQRDILGHLPWLLVPRHRQWIERLTAHVARYCFARSAVCIASRLYWRTAVTGLLAADGRTCLYGAALIADPTEGWHALRPFAKRSPLHVKRAASTPYADEPVTDYAITYWPHLEDAFGMIEHLTYVCSDFYVCPS